MQARNFSSDDNFCVFAIVVVFFFSKIDPERK